MRKIWFLISVLKSDLNFYRSGLVIVHQNWCVVHVTGGESGKELSSERRLLKGAKKFFLTEPHRAGMSWVTLASVGGRPSGIDLNLNVGRPSRELGPRDLSKRSWLYSVLTKVI